MTLWAAPPRTRAHARLAWLRTPFTHSSDCVATVLMMPLRSTGNLQSFDQRSYFPTDPNLVGMSHTGYVYIPTSCQRNATRTSHRGGAPCKLHVVFHGCEQGVDTVGTVFVQHAGYNSHAEQNGIVMLYPQAHTTILNPKGCWDWWGYTSPSYACQLGIQMAMVNSMVAALAGPR